MKYKVLVFSVLLPIIAAGDLWGRISLPGIFSDNMVLQRNMEVPVWGKALPGETVAVEFAGQRKLVSADAKGDWKLYLDPLSAGGPYELVVMGSDTLCLKNVMVGEVWLFSGQSNMQFMLKDVIDSKEELQDASKPQIRLFNVEQIMCGEPLGTCRPYPENIYKGNWQACNAETAKYFSAVAFFAAKDLQQELGVPVGIINASKGNSSAESWISRDNIAAHPQYRDILARYDEITAAYTKGWDDVVYKFNLYNKQWKTHVSNAWKEHRGWKTAGTAKTQPKPFLPLGEGTPRGPASLYNGMLHPIIPFAIRGVAWYQGESNSSQYPYMIGTDYARAIEYRNLLPYLIDSWREEWGQGSFPFIIIQLPNFNSDWRLIRESQLLTSQTTDNTGLVITIDKGDKNNIHPKDKKPVGERTAQAILADVYGFDMVATGPLFQGAEILKDSIVLSFENAGGLMAKGEELEGFEIAALSGDFLPAKAEIAGDKVIVYGGELNEPARVRYAWAGDPRCNLFNKEGFPASPFRYPVPMLIDYPKDAQRINRNSFVYDTAAPLTDIPRQFTAGNAWFNVVSVEDEPYTISFFAGVKNNEAEKALAVFKWSAEKGSGWEIKPAKAKLKLKSGEIDSLRFTARYSGSIEDITPLPFCNIDIDVKGLAPYSRQVPLLTKYINRHIGENRPVFTAGKALEAPLIDGVLNDKEWSRDANIEKLLVSSMDKDPGTETQILYCYDETNLYFAYKCYGQDSSSLKLDAVEHDGQTYYDDGIEFNIDTDPADKSFFHFVISAAGVIYDSEVWDEQWTSNALAASSFGDKTWTLEVAIPWSSIGVDINSADLDMRCLFARNEVLPAQDPGVWAPEIELTQWPLSTEGNHKPAMFAGLKLK